MNQPDKLVIFDYSGTLSLEAPQFARTENLKRELRESGLFALGVTTPNFFWEGIVGPTWVEGSTTTIGYKRIMAARVESLVPATDASRENIAAAASRFVDGYFDRSRIDPAWRPILEKLSANPEAALIIATDHYAEATGTIVRHLRRWNINAGKAGEASEPCRPTREGGEASRWKSAPFWIANSADIGFWKVDNRFWEALKRVLPLGRVRSVLIVDDFGSNEEQGDRYGETDRVEARQEKTVAVLEKAFQTTVAVSPFFLKGEERDRPGKAAARISETAGRIERFLNRGDES